MRGLQLSCGTKERKVGVTKNTREAALAKQAVAEAVGGIMCHDHHRIRPHGLDAGGIVLRPLRSVRERRSAALWLR